MLRDKRVLVLEDEPIIAMLLEELIEAAGGVPQCVTSLNAADGALEKSLPDVAILDINVRNLTSFDLARRLIDQGVPFIFASGYGQRVVPPDLAHVPMVTKPYGLHELEQAFRTAFGQKD